MSVGDVAVVTASGATRAAAPGAFSALLRRFTRVQGQERAIDEMQGRIEQAHNPIVDQPFFTGVLLQDVLLTSGSGNQIQHGLQRVPIGFVVAGANAAATVKENTSARSDSIIELQPSATVTVSLWVF